MGVGSPACCLSLIGGKKPALQAAPFLPLLPGDESADGNHRCPGKEENTTDPGG